MLLIRHEKRRAVSRQTAPSAPPNPGAGFARAVGGDGGQGGPIFNDQEEDWMPGRPINDQQHRLYITLRQKHPQKTAAAMAGFSPSTGHRAEKDPRLPSARSRDRRHGGGKPDPFAGLWEEEIAPLLRATPGLKPIKVLEETRPARSTVVQCALSPSAALTADSRASAVRAS